MLRLLGPSASLILLFSFDLLKPWIFPLTIIGIPLSFIITFHTQTVLRPWSIGDFPEIRMDHLACSSRETIIYSFSFISFVDVSFQRYRVNLIFSWIIRSHPEVMKEQWRPQLLSCIQNWFKVWMFIPLVVDIKGRISMTALLVLLAFSLGV